jgi:hypothetical protein
MRSPTCFSGSNRRPSNRHRPVIFHPACGTCRLRWVKALTVMVNSNYNRWRMEAVWLDK